MGHSLTRAAILALCLFVSTPTQGVQYATKLVGEGEHALVTLVILDQNGNLATPSEVYYWVDDGETDQRLLAPRRCCHADAISAGWCTVVPTAGCGGTIGSVMTLTLAPEAAAIVTDSKAKERHMLTAQIRYGGSGCHAAITGCKYIVDSLSFEVENENVVVATTTPGTAGPTPQATPTPG